MLTVILIIALVCFLWGILENGFYNLLSYVFEIIIAMVVAALIGGVIGLVFLSPEIFAMAGAGFGFFYTIYVWITRRYNKLVGWIFCH